MIPMALTPDRNASPDRQIVRRILVVGAVLGAAAAIFLGLREGPGAAISSLAGTLVGLGNLWAIATLVERLLSAGENKTRAGLLLVVKTFALFALAYGVVSRPWASGPGFMAGFTAVVFGIALGGLWGADPPRAGDKKED